jgi:hypothetical protein
MKYYISTNQELTCDLCNSCSALYLACVEGLYLTNMFNQIFLAQRKMNGNMEM